MKLFLVICSLLSCSLAALVWLNTMKQEEWIAYKAKHGKIYNDEQDQIRMKIYFDNKKLIKRHNDMHANGLKSYKLGINKFADKTFAELKKTNDYRFSQTPNSSITVPWRLGGFPRVLDWREQGAVTEVKDPQGCTNGDWAFSVTGAVEGSHFLTTGELVSLSEQNLIDCLSTSDNCDGGSAEDAFEYIKKNGGIDTEDFYPYKGEDGSCVFNNSQIGAMLTDYETFSSIDEVFLQFMLASLGPVSAHIYISGEWMFYKSGIFYEEPCPSEVKNLNHYVLVVGYGSENGIDYWLIKNSWGDNWGEGGYIRMARNKNNSCGITSGLTVPLH